MLMIIRKVLKGAANSLSDEEIESIMAYCKEHPDDSECQELVKLGYRFD